MTARFELASGQGDKKMPSVEGSAGGTEVRTLRSGSEQAARAIVIGRRAPGGTRLGWLVAIG